MLPYAVALAPRILARKKKLIELLLAGKLIVSEAQYQLYTQWAGEDDLLKGIEDLGREASLGEAALIGLFDDISG